MIKRTWSTIAVRSLCIILNPSHDNHIKKKRQILILDNNDYYRVLFMSSLIIVPLVLDSFQHLGMCSNYFFLNLVFLQLFHDNPMSLFKLCGVCVHPIICRCYYVAGTSSGHNTFVYRPYECVVCKMPPCVSDMTRILLLPSPKF